LLGDLFYSIALPEHLTVTCLGNRDSRKGKLYDITCKAQFHAEIAKAVAAKRGAAFACVRIVSISKQINWHYIGFAHP